MVEAFPTKDIDLQADVFNVLLSFTVAHRCLDLSGECTYEADPE